MGISSKEFILEYMLNKFSSLESDRISVINRASLHKIAYKDLHDMLVVETRIDTARDIFRAIRSIIEIYD